MICDSCKAKGYEVCGNICDVCPIESAPFGWYCELVHVNSETVVTTNFFRDAPITGASTADGYEWRATPVFTKVTK